MNNALYVSLSRQDVLFRKMNLVANNIANMNTPAYKANKAVFTEYLRDTKQTNKGDNTSFVYDSAGYSDIRQGNIVPTYNPLDMAITGDGYFKVRTPEGDKYTRNGSFTANSQGEITTQQGYQLLTDSGQPMALPEGGTDFNIREDGIAQVFVDGILEEIGQVGVFRSENPQAFEAAGDGLYSATNVTRANVESYKIRGGMIESSNVNSVSEMVDMIEISRAVSSSVKTIKDLNDLVRRAIETIGKAS